MQLESIQDHLEIDPPIPGELEIAERAVTFTPYATWSKAAVVRVLLEAGTRSKLGLSVLDDQQWTFTVSPAKLVYLWPYDQPANLYMVDIHSGETRQLTNTTAGVQSFSISSDGMELFYSQMKSNSGADLYAWERSSRKSSLLLDCGEGQCSSPQVSPDGRFLAYILSERLGAQPGLWVYDLNMGSRSLISSLDKTVDVLSWTTTGLLTYFIPGENRVVMIDPEAGDENGFYIDSEQLGSWSLDGSTYLTNRLIPVSIPGLQEALSSHLTLYTVEKHSLEDLTVVNNLEDSNAAFSTDGQWIAFGRKSLSVDAWTPGRQLWVMRPDGSGAHQLTDEPSYHHTDFTWSPDSQKIAFMRFNQTKITDPPELWLIDAAGTQPLRLVIGAYSPGWMR